MKYPDITPVMFLYLSGVIDILISAIVIFNGWGTEATEVYNWIHPTWLMFLAMIAANTLFCIVAMVVYVYVCKHPHPAVRPALMGMVIILYGLGVVRLVVGAGSGLVIMLGVLV